MTVTVDGARASAGLTPGSATTLRHDDLEAMNSQAIATPVAPQPLDEVTATEAGARVTVPAASWSVVRLSVA